MSIHLSEEEQLENLKRWWKDYGKSIIVAAILAIAAYFAYTSWEDHKRQLAEQASATYEELLKLVAVDAGKALTEENRTKARVLADQLKTNDPQSLYAYTAAFFMAKLAVEDNKLDQAAAELNWVLSAKPDAGTAQVARLRLARVLAEQKQFDQALAQLDTAPDAAFASEYDEVRGDVLKQQGVLDAARTAYEKALAATSPQQQERYMLLQMKIDDLKSPDAVSAKQTEAAADAAVAAPEEKAQ